VQHHSIDWQSRAHFFGIAAQVMRRILVDHNLQRIAIALHRFGNGDSQPRQRADERALSYSGGGQ
jgi:hypothetical protein